MFSHQISTLNNHSRPFQIGAKIVVKVLPQMMPQFIRAFAMLVCLLVLSGCGERYSWNQKLTVEVQTPDGVVSGSSVTSVKIVMKTGLLDIWDGDGSFASGEAAVVDLGKGKYVFALMDGATHWAFNAVEIDTRKTWELIGPIIKRSENPYKLSGENSPMFVTFDDINDPASVKEVNPNNLTATFGSGYTLKSITLEITDEPVAVGEVEKVLGWLDDYYNKRLDGQRFGDLQSENAFANSLSSGAFDTVK